MDPTNSFGELTFLQLISKGDAPLPKNPFIIGKSVENAAGQIEGAVTEAQGTKYTLRVRNPAQVEKLLKMTKLIDETEVIVQPHPNLNISRCVISSFDLIHMDEKDILEGLVEQREGVIFVKRITRMQDGKRVNTPALILTFNKCTYPSHVKIGLLRTSTRPYYPNPLLCYGCFSYGHPRARCPGPQRCFNCSNEHQEEECREAAHCRNCDGNHRPNSRQCPVYKKEMDIIRVKVDNNITYPEAKKRVGETRGSYAAVTAQQTADRVKIEALEKKMQERDAQIAQILGEIKKKDESIKQMKALIQKLQATEQMKLINSQTAGTSKQQTQPQTLREPRVAQITGNSMQLRNRSRSPAIPEQVRGDKKTKRQGTKTPTISPERQSPPVKRTQSTNFDEVIVSDDEANRYIMESLSQQTRPS